jgi:hypothetical protein
MKAKTLLIVISLIFFSNMAMAWDEVTHGFMTDKIIDEIKVPELKQLLERNRNEFLSGSWLTDTYQYTHKRYETLNSHNLDIHCNAYLNYLQKEEVKQQPNYEQLVAILLGSMAHTTEDFWLDNILYEYPKSIGEKVTGDTFNGVIAIKKNGYLCKKVKRYFPANDMYAMYKDANLLEPDYDTPEKFSTLYEKWSSKQYEQLMLLKFLSFLASNQVQNKSPWMSANLMTVTGGMLSSVNNSARYIEAVWKKFHNVTVEGLLNVEYSGLDSRLGLLVSFSHPITNQDSLAVYVVDSKLDTLKGAINAFSFGGTKTNLINLVYKFQSDSVLLQNNEYVVILHPTNTVNPEMRFSFKAITDTIITDYPQKPKSFFSTLGAGLFLFIICTGIGGILVGISGLFSFIPAIRNKRSKYTVINRVFYRVFLFAGVLIILLGIYLFVTKGWLVILNV